MGATFERTKFHEHASKQGSWYCPSTAFVLLKALSWVSSTYHMPAPLCCYLMSRAPWNSARHSSFAKACHRIQTMKLLLYVNSPCIS